jgi:hypothetical protein
VRSSEESEIVLSDFQPFFPFLTEDSTPKKIQTATHLLTSSNDLHVLSELLESHCGHRQNRNRRIGEQDNQYPNSSRQWYLVSGISPVKGLPGSILTDVKCSRTRLLQGYTSSFLSSLQIPIDNNVLVTNLVWLIQSGAAARLPVVSLLDQVLETLTTFLPKLDPGIDN